MPAALLAAQHHQVPLYESYAFATASRVQSRHHFCLYNVCKKCDVLSSRRIYATYAAGGGCFCRVGYTLVHVTLQQGIRKEEAKNM